jgi:hypothetical protein
VGTPFPQNHNSLTADVESRTCGQGLGCCQGRCDRKPVGRRIKGTGKGALIVHLIVKCLKILKFDFLDLPDTDDLYAPRNELTRCAVHVLPCPVGKAMRFSVAAMSSSDHRVAIERITATLSLLASPAVRLDLLYGFKPFFVRDVHVAMAIHRNSAWIIERHGLTRSLARLSL